MSRTISSHRTMYPFSVHSNAREQNGVKINQFCISSSIHPTIEYADFPSELCPAPPGCCHTWMNEKGEGAIGNPMGEHLVVGLSSITSVG